MERGRWEGQNFQPLKEVQRLEEEEGEIKLKLHIYSWAEEYPTWNKKTEG